MLFTLRLLLVTFSVIMFGGVAFAISGNDWLEQLHRRVRRRHVFGCVGKFDPVAG